VAGELGDRKGRDFDSLMRRVYGIFDALIDSVKRRSGVRVDCKNGCSYCCELKVDVSPLEVLYLARMVECMKPSDGERVGNAAKARHEHIQGKTHPQLLSENYPCPLLHDGSCSAYVGRPFFCRSFHAQTVETCRYSHANLHEPSGGFSVMFNGRAIPVRSPIAQNYRHIEILGDYLAGCNVLPKRFGLLPILPTFENWVLVQPGSPLPKKYDGARLVQRDQFSKTFDAFLEDISVTRIRKLMLRSELGRVADKLAEESKANRRICEQFPAIAEPAPQVEEPPTPEPRTVQAIVRVVGNRIACSKCKAVLTPQEYGYCKINFSKLGKQFLCKKCQ